MWWQKKLMVLVMIFSAGILVGALAMRMTTVPKTTEGVEELPTAIINETKMTASPAVSPTPLSGLKYDILATWKTYDKTFQKLRFTFRYPGNYPIQDGDQDSGNITLTSPTDSNMVLEIGRLSYYGWQEYDGGGRREWYTKALARTMPGIKIESGDIAFTPIVFANGNNYYKVEYSKNIQNYMGASDADTYFGIFGGKAIIVTDWNKLPKADVLRVMQSLIVR